MHRDTQVRWDAVCRPSRLVSGRWLVDLYGRSPGRQSLFLPGPSTRTLLGARRVARRLIRRQLLERGGRRGRVLVDRA